ncbi:hypothetical protein AVEN_139387-1 [Araneus ventricosus]|uniref:C2H2-type domain-containing protein n=1 Tax=Araneus ventricosus TaxID=182803 RepID=A0A4Y2GT67_ARAVE|nr:hypothetical protein AVEN_139387-1 [Araneus ventricosus]
MEPPLNDNGIIIKSSVAQLKEMRLKIHKKKDFGETFSSSLIDLNENGLPGTSNTSEFTIKKLPKTKSLVNNNVIINYAGSNDWNKSLPTEEDPKKSLSANLQSISSDVDLLLHFADKRDNVLPVIRNNALSVKNSKPDPFQLQAEAYNNQVKASISKPLGGNEIYFGFRVQESRHKIIHYKEIAFQCHICKGIYKQKFSLKRHFLRNHINPEYISAADLSNCKIPIQNEEIIQKFVEESKTPSGRKRFKLSNAIFFVPDGITRVPGLYKCHRCPGIQFDIEEELEEHYSSHLILNRDDIFPCNLCPSVFQRKQALSKHMVLHTDKKVIFHCKKCPRQFEKITDYTCHLQSHGSGKRCKYCDKEFSTPANRKRHENIHERGRVFSCRLCKAKFSRSKELEKHTKKMHSNLKLTCPHCPMQANAVIFTSQYLLEAHLTLKHRNIPVKKFVASNKTTGMYKTHSPKLSKECICCYCKKKFSTVKAMVNHKNLVHKNETALHKPKKFRQKELTKEKPQDDSEGSRKLKNVSSNGKVPGEKNATSKADDHARKTGILGKKRTTYERKAKSSSQYKLSKDKSYRKKDEAEKKFYSNVSSNVADNLLNHVDGGPNQINLKLSSFEDQNQSFDYRSNTSEIPWSAHNFSNYFDFGNAVSKREEKSQLFPQEQCLYATGLERNEVSVENILNLSSENSSAVEEIAQSNCQNSPLILEEKSIFLNHKICATYVCDVCKGTFPSYSAFEDHSVNNHPNVEMSFVEIEGTSKNPPKVPGELRRLPYTQPNGILVSCEVPLPTQEQFDIKCTKCETRFNNKNELYAHIFQCVAETRDNLFRRKLNQKKRKGLAVKSQIDLAIKPVKSSGWFIRNKQIFKSGCFRRNKFQGGKYYFNIKGNKRGRRRLPLPSKLRPNPCPHCESVFISSAKLPEHVEICTYRFKGEEYKLKKKCQVKKRKNDRSPSPISVGENGSSSDAVKNSEIVDKDTSLLSYSNDHVFSTESQVALSEAEVTLSTANHSLTASLESILIASDGNDNRSDLNCEKTVAVERNILKTSELSDFDVLRNLVREVEPMLPKDLQVDDVSESCVKRKELIYNSLADNSRKNASAKSGKSTKNENIAEPFTAGTKETLPGLGSINLPKIKEVVKEIQLAASSLPNLKKSNAPLTFLSSEVNQTVEHSSQNNNSPVQTGLNSQSGKEPGATNESQGAEKARQRKKRKPVKIMHKMTNETESSLKIGLSPFSNKAIGSCLTPFTLENNSFKHILNSGEQILSANNDPEIPKLPDLVPEKDKVDFPKSDEKCSTNALESSTVSSDNIQINTDGQGLSTTVFLPEDKPEGSGDRDSPSLEVLVSSVTQSIENFDKPSLLDDEKFALQAPDLINPTAIKSTDMNLTSNNGLNFKILMPTGESPSKSQVPDKDSLNYFATKISADKPTNESSLPVSSNKNNVKTSVINKMKSILHVAENATNTVKLKELIDNKVGNNVSSSAKNTLPVNDNVHALTPQLQNRSATSSTTVNLLEGVSPESQQSLCSDEIGKELNKTNREITGKSASRQKCEDKKGDGDKKGNDDSSDSKKSVQGQFAMADKVDAVNLIPGQKSKQLKDKVKSKMMEVVQSASNETARTELQKKKTSSKIPLSKKCDSTNNKGISPKLPVENHQPKLALEANNQLTNKNEDKVESGVSTSENSAKLRFLRMKRPAPDEFSDQTANENTRSNNSSETEISHNQISERKKMLNISGGVAAMTNSGSIAMMNNSEAVATVNSSGGVGALASIGVSKVGGNCKDNCSKSLDDFHVAGGDRDVVVKKEKPDNEIVTHRNCPYCYLDFAYLSNFRRHLKLCPSRTGNAASEAPATSTSSQFQHLPKKNEVEESMLNLLRHQSRQNELIKETQKAEDSKAKNSFQKFSCPICHKIYLSYFSFIQHVVKAHKMTNQETKTADPYGPSTSQGVRVMPLEESENNVHQETRTSDPYGPSTSQGVRVMPLEESGSENNMQFPEVCDSNLAASDIPSELSANRKNSTTTVESSVKETSQVDASKKEGNTSSVITHVELKSDNKEIKSGSIQNAARCFENMNSSDGSNSAGKIKTISSSPDGRNVSISQNDNELSDLSLLTLPAYGKGRGRKKKSVQENLSEKKEDLKAEGQSNKAEDISSVNEPRGDNSISKKEPVTNNPLLKEVGKALLSDLKSSPKNTLVNKLRSTLSKSMQSGGNLKATPSKFSKKSETPLKSADASDVKHLEKDSSSFKSPIKKNPIETSKIIDKTDILCISQSLNIPRRGRKKSVVARVSVKQSIRGFKQESNEHLSQIDVPSEAIASSVEVIETESNSRLHDTPKSNKLKSLRNQSLPGPVSPTVSDDKNILIKKSITNAFQSSKMTKAVKSTKAFLQEVNSDAQSSQKSNAVSNKVRSPRGIKANCDNDPSPSTSYGPSRGRKNRVINLSLDLSSELEDVEDIQQRKPKQKKKPNNKVCPICKQKFPTLLQRNRHLQLVHGRKRSRTEGSISPTSVPVKKETCNKITDSFVKKETVNKVADSPAIVPDRSAYQRQCSKPLPPMKRKYEKVGKNIQPVKKTKF